MPHVRYTGSPEHPTACTKDGAREVWVVVQAGRLGKVGRETLKVLQFCPSFSSLPQSYKVSSLTSAHVCLLPATEVIQSLGT